MAFLVVTRKATSAIVDFGKVGDNISARSHRHLESITFESILWSFLKLIVEASILVIPEA